MATMTVRAPPLVSIPAVASCNKVVETRVNHGRGEGFRLPRAFMRKFHKMVTVLRALAFSLLLPVMSAAAGSSCLPLRVEQTIALRYSANVGACFTFVTREPVRVSTTQPIDLRLILTGSAAPAIVDGFEFGDEQCTIVDPGTYHIQIKPIGSGPRFLALTVTLKAVSMREAKGWMEAETLATLSKGNPGDKQFADSLRAWQALGDGPSIARTWLKQGDWLLSTSEVTRARDSYDQGWTLCSTSGDRRCLAESSNNSGWCSFLLGDYVKSGSRLHQASSLWAALSMPVPEGRTLSNIGLLYLQAGELEKAIGALLRARDLLASSDPVGHARVMHNIGLYYGAVSEHRKALGYFHGAFRFFSSTRRSTTRLHLNSGRSYMALGNLKQARAAFLAGLAEAGATHDKPAHADALAYLGQEAFRGGRMENAHQYLRDAVTMQREVHSKRGEATALHYLGEVTFKLGDADSARGHLTEAARIRRDSGLLDEAAESQLALAQMEFANGRTRQALERLHQAIGGIETVRAKVADPLLRASYFAGKRRFFDLLTEAMMSLPDSPKGAGGLLAADLARGRSILDIQAGTPVSDSISQELLARQSGVLARIALLGTHLGDAEPSQAGSARSKFLARRQEQRLQLEIAIAEAERIAAEIRARWAATSFGRPIQSWEEFRSAIPEGSAVLEYNLGKQSYLWVATGTELRHYPLPSRTEIESVAARWIRLFADYDRRRGSPQLQGAFQTERAHLSRLLLGPLQGVALPRRLILVLDGILNRVPVEALIVPGSRDALGLAFEIVRSPSAAYLVAAKPPREHTVFSQSMLAVADAVLSTEDAAFTTPLAHTAGRLDLPRLPFAQERTFLQSLLPGRLRVVRRFDATPRVLQAIDLSRFGLIHFAAHAIIEPGIPEASHIVLTQVDRNGRQADGNLYPFRMAGYRLDGATVVLAACESAGGKDVPGEGVTGFATAFLAAGASQVVASMAKVDAEFAPVFFREVYRRLLGPSPVSMEAAIRDARREILKPGKPWGDPFFWSTFTIIGRPSNNSGFVRQ
ncbi:MAG: CHAT domain-containing protein [Bryobacteraceae bacterium]